MIQSVDVIEFRSLRVFVLKAFWQNDELRSDSVGFKASHDKGFAPSMSGHIASLSNLGTGFVVRAEKRQGCYVTVSAV